MGGRGRRWCSIAFVLGALAACDSSTSGTTNGETECRDTEDNELHCGSCGHTCYGGACKAGKCLPASFPSGNGAKADDAKTFVGNDEVVVWGGEYVVTMTYLDTYAPWVGQGRAAPDLTAKGFAYWSDDAGLHRTGTRSRSPSRRSSSSRSPTRATSRQRWISPTRAERRTKSCVRQLLAPT